MIRLGKLSLKVEGIKGTDSAEKNLKRAIKVYTYARHMKTEKK